MSAESGIDTFRSNGGLWDNHKVEDVASIDGWNKDPKKVMDFYNLRRVQLGTVEPNQGHKDLVKLEEKFDVQIITQNVDDLHERGGSKNILHLHGFLREVKDVTGDNIRDVGYSAIDYGTKNSTSGDLVRPNIVWFGENVPMMKTAASTCHGADYLIVIGTSLQVYPAAEILDYIPHYCKLIIIDPNISTHLGRKIRKPATSGIKEIVKELLDGND